MDHKVNFILPSTDFKQSLSKSLTVKSSLEPGKEITGDIEFSVVIPDYIFDALANTEPKFSTTYDQNSRGVSGCFSKKCLTRKFQKTQHAVLISILQDYIYSLTCHLLDKHSIETNSMTRKLFISFGSATEYERNRHNGAYMGERISQSFRYFTGYQVITDKFSGITRKLEKRYISKIYYAGKDAVRRKNDTCFKEKEDLFLLLTEHNESVEQFESRFSIIDWTEEREDFCKKIQETFVDVNSRLSSFLSNLDNKKIDLLISEKDIRFLTEK